MKLRTKVIFGFSSLVILLLTAGTLAYLSVNRVSRSADIFRENVFRLDIVDSLRLAIDRSLMPPNDYLIHGNVAERENFSLISNQVDQSFKALYRMGFSEEEQALIKETETSYAGLRKKALCILNDEVECENAAAVMEEMDTIGDDVINKINLLSQRAYEKVVITARQEHLYRSRTNLILLICAALFVIDATLSSLFIWRSISRPLWLLQDGVRTITGGKLDHRVSVQTHGEFGEFADSFNDMVERLQGAFSDLEQENDKLQTILLNIVDGVIVADAQYNMLFMNPVAETILEKQYSELKGKKFFDCHKEKNRVLKIIQDDKLPISKKFNFNSRVIHINAASIKKNDGTEIGYLMIVRDITEQEKARSKLEELAITDSLTKLYNHGYFQHCIGFEFSKAERYNTPLSLMLIDIDYFKSYNDQYGHQMGDLVLIALSKLLKENVRSIDIVARYGGEEFVVILPNITAKGSQPLAERLRKKTESHLVGSMLGRSVNITISIGVASYNGRNFANKEELIKCADTALYKAKRSGRNRVEVSL